MLVAVKKNMNRIQIKPSREARVMMVHADEITKRKWDLLLRLASLA